MKKLIFIQLFIVLCITGTFAQLKVMSDGKVAIRGTSSPYGTVQVNTGYGDNNGFCIFDTQWSKLSYER